MLLHVQVVYVEMVVEKVDDIGEWIMMVVDIEVSSGAGPRPSTSCLLLSLQPS